MTASPTPSAPSTRYRLRQTGCPTCLQPRRLTTDKPISLQSVYIRARKIERQYATRLRSIASHIGDLVVGANVQDLPGATRLQEALNRYGQVLTPWAEAVGSRMVAEIARHDARSWLRRSSIMGEALKREIAEAPTGAVMREALAEQVRLITSLPVEAGERVHELTIKGISAGTRADVVAAEIMRTGEVTKARADLIARTETSRTATALTQARAEHVGSVEFIWRTAEDSDVRASHRKLNGRTFRWDDPPECDPGHRALPGAIWNCRCYPEPIIPEA